MKTTVTWAGMLGLVLATSVCGLRPAAATPPTVEPSIPVQYEEAPPAEAAPVEVEVEALPAPQCCTPLLSKVPYISRLFKNVGVARGCMIKLSGDGGGEVLGVDTSQRNEACFGPGRLGINYQIASECQQKCEPCASEAVATCKDAPCTGATCTGTLWTNAPRDVAKACTAATACRSSSACKGCEACTATASCACGEGCQCCKSAPVVASPYPWFPPVIPGVHRPTVFRRHHIAIPAHTVPAPHPPVIAAPSAGHPQGCPFKSLHERLVAAEIEKARLEGRVEAREEFAAKLVDLAAEAGKLQATVELAGQIVELKDQQAEQQREFLSELLEMKSEHLETLAQFAVEKAKLEAQVELARQRQELTEEFLTSQVELVKSQTALEAQAAMIEEKLESAEQLRTENDELKRQLAELRGKLQGNPYETPHTATRPTIRDEEPATEK